jgi:riboflavin synthase
MFTGIIEALGKIVDIQQTQTNTHFAIESDIGTALKVDQSVSHNGVCLTVTKVEDNKHWVTAIDETLKKTNLGHLQKGSSVNLERCMVANGRFDGHIVQGHVDQVAICKSVKDENGSWLYDFEYDATTGNVTVEKGSVCINGVSLTCFNAETNSFRVAIIPYTYEHTTFKDVKPGDTVNLEFDIVGKYVKRLLGK